MLKIISFQAINKVENTAYNGVDCLCWHFFFIHACGVHFSTCVPGAHALYLIYPQTVESMCCLLLMVKQREKEDDRSDEYFEAARVNVKPLNADCESSFSHT